jgi:hypothetical protein
MPNYSVVLKISGASKKQIKGRLRTALGSAAARGAEIVKAGEQFTSYDACQASGHFGCVHWTDEDLHSKLEELNFPVTSEILDALKLDYGLRHIADLMVVRGWEVIEQSINDANIPEKHS